MILSFNACKTVYFNSDWEETTKDKQVYYRPNPKQIDGLWLIKDYYKNGVLQFEGSTKDIELELWEGDLTWYKPNGKIEDKVRYKNGIVIGHYIILEGSVSGSSQGDEGSELYYLDYTKKRKKPANAVTE